MPRRKTITLAIAGVVLVAAGVAGGVWALNATQAKASGSQQDAIHDSAGTTTVAVVRRDLQSRIQVNGTLGYANANQPVSSQSHGTLTWIAPEGSVIQRGQTLYEVDGQPVILFYGDRPAWRSLSMGVSDGADVKQLQDNLIALGYASTSNLNDDGHFSWATYAAIKRWQKAVGLAQTGSIDLGQIVFLPSAVRVGTHQAQVGSPVGGVIMSVSSTTRVVTVDLDASKQTLLKVGDPVTITMPNTGKTTTGTVSDIARVAKSGQGQNGGSQTTVTVTINLTDPSATGDLDQAPVRVGITTSSAKNVLAVPINALLALSDGGYGVEVDESGSRHIVRVQTGLFDDDGGMVEISGGGITAGTQVVVPA